MKNSIKNIVKIVSMISLCLILFEGYAQNTPSDNNVNESDFVCFSYDGGIHTIFTPNLMDLHNPTPKNTIKRSSMEDIMFENIDTDGEIVDNKIKEEDPETSAILAKK